jgi:hypothetical protein
MKRPQIACEHEAPTLFLGAGELQWCGACGAIHDGVTWTLPGRRVSVFPNSEAFDALRDGLSGSLSNLDKLAELISAQCDELDRWDPDALIPNEWVVACCLAMIFGQVWEDKIPGATAEECLAATPRARAAVHACELLVLCELSESDRKLRSPEYWRTVLELLNDELNAEKWLNAERWGKLP